MPATVVIIEDLHWIDAASEEFIEALADAVVGTTTLLVVNFRPGICSTPDAAIALSPNQHASPPAGTSGHPVAGAFWERLLRSALLSRNIIERAQGNPFFLEELVNALVERGDFEGEKGAYRLKGGIDTIPLPQRCKP